MAHAMQTFDTGHQDLVHDAQFDFYGKRVATCSSDRVVKVYDVGADEQYTQTAEITGHEGPVWEVAWAHPQFGSLLATCGYDRRVMVWRETSPGSWMRVYAFEGHASSVNSIAWAPPELGLHLAAASSDGKVSVLSHRDEDDAWDVAMLEDSPLGVNAVSWAPALPSADGTAPVRRIATAGCDGKVRVYSCAHPGQTQTQHHHAQGRAAGGWALEKTLARSASGGAGTGAGSPSAGGSSSEWVRDVAWCPAGLAVAAGLATDPAAALLLASCSDDGIVSLWRPSGSASSGAEAEWTATTLPPFPAPVWRLSWSVTGRLLAVSCGDNSVTLWKEDLSGTWQQVSNVPVAAQ